MNSVTVSKTPPAAKVVTAKGAAVSNVIGQLTELAAVFCAAYLLSIGKLSEDHFMYVLGAAILGPAVSKIRGVPAASSLSLIGAFLPWIAKKSML